MADADVLAPPRPVVSRYLRTFVVTVALTVLVVVAINLAAFAVMTRPENAAIVQLLDGWSRLYKPILYDVAEPEVVVFGASYARDAFDPEEVGALIGMRFFNFAVSGGAAYENRRFAQSALTNPNLKAVILPLDSFVARPGAPKVSYGFDESVLNLTADGALNGTVALNRALAITLSGAAVGNNIQLFRVLAEHAAGARKEDLLFSYERRDNTKQASALAEARARIFPPAAPAGPAEALALPEAPRTSGLPEFDRTIEVYCDRDIDIHVYVSPRPRGACPQPVDRRLAALAYLQVRQEACRARLHFHDFQYPNAVTLEGVAADVPLSLYYRPDGHPRPTVGELMAAVMFGKPFPAGTPEAIKADFGADLMTHTEPLAWWQRRLARCEGVWVASDLGVVTRGAVAR
jgi:hypothetical protein